MQLGVQLFLPLAIIVCLFLGPIYWSGDGLNRKGMRYHGPDRYCPDPPRGALPLPEPLSPVESRNKRQLRKLCPRSFLSAPAPCRFPGSPSATCGWTRGGSGARRLPPRISPVSALRFGLPHQLFACSISSRCDSPHLRASPGGLCWSATGFRSTSSTFSEVRPAG